MKPYRVEYVQIAGWENADRGLWLAENETWLLLRHISYDYVVDGYMLIAKEHIVSRKPKKDRKQTEQILKLKGIKTDVPPGFAFLEMAEMLRWVEHRFGMMEFTDEADNLWLGWLHHADAVHVWFNSLEPDGTVALSSGEDDPLVISEIQFLRFDTDYINSLKLLWQHKSRQKLLKPSDN